MAGGNIPVPTLSTPPVVLVGGFPGTRSANARDILLRWINHLLANGWHVVQSYNANGSIPAPGVMTWLTYVDIKGSIDGGGIGGSWLVLGNDHNPMQMMLAPSVSGDWFELATFMSPGAGFTGGTTGAHPTAVDQVSSTVPGYIFGTGSGGTDQFYAFAWTASDGSYTRVAWVYGGHIKIIWEFSALSNFPTGWTKPYMLESYYWGSVDVTAVGNRQRAIVFMIPFGSAGSCKALVTPAPDTPTSQIQGTLDSSNSGPIINFNNVANPFSNQYLWIQSRGMSRTGGAASANGFWGYLRDEWWVPKDTFGIFNDFDTMGDNFDFIIIGQRVLQWGIGDPNSYGLGLAVPSTNYPTARFYGRGERPCVCPPVPPPVVTPDPCWCPDVPLPTPDSGSCW